MIARAFVLKMLGLGHRVIACSVGEQHLHILVELENVYETMKAEVGKCKQKASHRVRDHIRGTIWSAGGEFKRINDADHFQNTYDYIRTRQEAGSVIWSHNPEEDWIHNGKIAVILMGPGKKHQRVYSP